jgi:hypothetical protein
MIKRCIGIDIGSSYLCAVQIAHTEGEFCIEKVLCKQIRRSTDSPVDLLKLLCSKKGFDRHAEIAVSMPHDAVFFRNLETDSVSLEQIREHNWSALEHNFPVEPDSIAAQAYSCNPLPDGKYSVLTAAAANTSLHERINIFKEVKLHPALLEAPIFAVHSTIAVNHPEIMTGRAVIAYIDERYLTLAVTREDNVLVVRSIPLIVGADSDTDSAKAQIAELLSREIKITWRKVFASDFEEDTRIYLVTTDNSSEHLTALIQENLHCQIKIVDCYSRIKSLPEHRNDLSICVAEGLALRVLAPEQTKGINLLESVNFDAEPALNLKKELVTCTTLIGTIVIILIVGLFIRLSRLEAGYSSIKNEATEIFKTALPNENVVSPLVQLEQKLESFRKDSRLFASLSPAAPTPLDVLLEISNQNPSQSNIEVDDILIVDNTVRINGTCSSFESAYQWQRLLEEATNFTSVEVKDVQKQSSSTVSFTMLLSSSIKELK